MKVSFKSYASHFDWKRFLIKIIIISISIISCN
jgi:hypothetical protein